MVDCACASLAARDTGLAFGRLASPKPVLRGTAKGANVVAHDSARHSVNLCAALVQPAEEMGKPGRVRADGIGGPATVGQIDQELLDLAYRLSIRPQDAERGLILGHLSTEKMGIAHDPTIPARPAVGVVCLAANSSRATPSFRLPPNKPLQESLSPVST